MVGTGLIGSTIQYGNAVRISADGNTAVVAAPAHNSNYGCVLIYVRSGSSWVQQGGTLTGSPITGTTPRFGASVAISGDGNTVAIGCDDLTNSTRGAVFIWTRSGSTWTQQAKLVGTGAVGLSLQGQSVAMSADGNTVITGGYFDNNFVGATWVFTRSGTTWSEQAKLVGTGNSGQSRQGYALDISGDGNTVAVGGYNDNGAVGKTWVFTRSGSSWSQQAALVGTGNIGTSQQGSSVALNSTDGNTLLVGGNGDDNTVGAAWVFTRSGSSWSQQAKLLPTSIAGQANVGQSVELSADGNTAILGASNDNSQIGATFVYSRSGTTWTQQGTKLVGTGGTGGGYQGNSVSLSNNGILIIGGPLDNSWQGAFWTFTVPPSPPTITSFTPSSGSVGTLVTITGTNLSAPTALSIGGVAAAPVSNDGTTLVAMVMPGATTGAISVTTGDGTGTSGSNFTVTSGGIPAAQDGLKLTGTSQVGAAQFGQSVAISADGNTAAVGAWQDNSNMGAVFVFVKSGGVWAQQAKLVGTGGGSNLRQGTSVAISADGNTILVGEYQDVCQEVYIFTRTGTTWSQQARIPNPGDRFGSGVSLSADGNTAAIGGFYAFGNQGRTWVYTRTAGVWSLQQTLTPSSYNTAGGFGGPLFGYSNALSADGNTLVVGAPADGDLSTNAGAVYVFTRTAGVWSQQSKVGSPSPLFVGSFWGNSVAISADGNTYAAGGTSHNNPEGAVLVYTRSGITWSQEAFLTFTGRIGWPTHGNSVGLSADGNTLVEAGFADNTSQGACWVFTRSGTIWTQQAKLVGTGNSGAARQGWSVSISADGKTLLSGGPLDASNTGAAWVFTPPPPPTITSFTPATGCPGSASITITGTNFTGASAVTIGGTAVSSFTVNSATEIVAIAGAGTTGTIQVTTAGGVCSSAGVFTMISSPSAAVTAGGATTFCAGGSVSLDGTTAATNNALDFDGTSGKLTRLSGGGSIPIGNSPYTIEMWVKPDNITGANGLVGWGNWGNTNEVNAFRFNGPTQLINYWWGNDLVVNIPFVLDGNWHHVAATFDGTTRKIYFDGALMGQDTPTGHNVSNNDNIEIGTTCPGCDLFLDGQIDELRIWNVGRTASQIANNKNSMVAANSTGLVAYFSANEGTGGSTSDIVSSTTMALESGSAWATSTAPVSPYSYLWSPGGATTPVITASATGNYTVTVTSTVTGCATTSAPLTVTARPLPVAMISGTTGVCKNGTAPLVTFTGFAGTDPYTFTYKVNGGSNQTVTTSSGSSVTVSAPTSTTGTFTYSLVSISDANGCSQVAAGSATITVNTLPTASIFGTTTVCQNATAPSATFLGSAGTAPYTFTYQINGGGSQTVTTSSGNNVSVSVPTSTIGAYAYSLVGVADINGCYSSASGTATISVTAAPAATVTPSGSTTLCPGGSVTLTTTAGIANKNIAFDGASGVDCGNDLSLKGNNGTIEAWFKTSDAGTGLRAIVDKPYAWGLFLYDNKICAYDWGVGSIYTGTVALNDNNWHHVAFTFRSGVAGASLVYVDGVQVSGSLTFNIYGQGSALEIGDNTTGVIQHFSGEIDEVRVWNTVRTVSQINDNKGKIVDPTTTGLVAYYRLDEGTGTTLTDLTGKGNTGTLTGSAPWGSSTAPVASVQYAWTPSGASTPAVTASATNSYAVTVSDVVSGCATTVSTPVTVLDIANANVVTGPNQNIAATHECTDGTGWTHYMNLPGNLIVLSIFKDGASFGSIGDPGFAVQSHTTPSWSAFSAAQIASGTAPYVDNPTGWYVMKRWWNVSPTSPLGSNVLVRTYYHTDDLAGLRIATGNSTLAHSKLRFYKINGGSSPNPDPDNNPATNDGHAGVTVAGTYSASGYWEYYNSASSSTTTWAWGDMGSSRYYAEYAVASFSGGGGGGAPDGGSSSGSFPVEWLSFEGRATQSGNLLNWITASESNNAGFTVEKSLDGRSFTQIGFVAGSGNSTSNKSYDFLDTEGGTAYYRLRQMDVDGNVSYSSTINVSIDSKFQVLVYPNPIRDFVTIENATGNVQIFNSVGQQVYSQPVAGIKTILDLTSLPAGVYTLQTLAANGQRVAVQVVK